MPIIINGGSYSDGGWWSKHLRRADTNERVTVVEFGGLSAEDIPGAFREMEALAAATKCKNYFYQANINPRADEHLTPKQWQEAVDRLEKNLGLTGQPRFVVEHEKEGRTHRHVIWSRIDTERMVAISDSLTAAIHERTSRELEIRFDLERGQSVLTPNRDGPRPDRRPKKNETFRSAESGIDVEVVKVDVRAAKERSDNGQSFRSALEASGDYVLARGDRRDFVVIDRAGDDHSLARRLGIKTAEMRSFMADLDPAILPSVPEAKAQQLARHAAPEREAQPGRDAGMEHQSPAASGPYAELRAAQTASQFAAGADRLTEPRAPVFDRDADNAAWMEAVAAAAIAKAEAADKISDQPAGEGKAADPDRPAAPGRYAALQPPAPARKSERELSGTAAEMRLAWRLTCTASELEDGLAARCIGLAQVGAEDAYASERRAALAREAGSFAPVWREGEIVAVDGRGGVYRFNGRTTGDKRGDIEGRLSGIDRAALMNVADTQEAMRAASLAAWKEERRAEREQARPASWIEQRIAACAADAPAVSVRDAQGRSVSEAAALADRLKADDERTHQAATVHGADALAARLNDAGIAIVRVTDADEPALADLRRDAEHKRLAAEANGHSFKGNRLAEVLPGELAAVTRTGDVYRINAAKIGDAARLLPDALPGVIETRERFAAERADKAAQWELKRAEIEAARQQRQGDRALGQAVATAERAVHTAFETPAAAVGKTLRKTGKVARVAERLFESAFGLLFGAFMAPPKDTRAQAEQKAKAATNEETLHAEAHAAAEAARAARMSALLRQMARDDEIRRVQDYNRSGGAGSYDRPAERGDDYERERER